MIIYDETSLAFIRKAELMLRQIIAEAGLEVRRSRFVLGKLLYPIHVVVFEGSEIGHFNAPYYQIGLNRRLIAEAKDAVLRDILRHEFAHYLTYIEFGEVSPHGTEFRATCSKYGFSPEVAAATINLLKENEKKEGDLTSEKVLEKAKKLFQLAQSSNAHEAELATLKANELLLRHNLNFVDGQTEEPLYLERVLYQKRKDAKLMAVYEILRHFIVRPVVSMGKNVCCLEVSGTKTNVMLAQYVANFLNEELDRLWLMAKKEHRLQGLRARNSFFAGVAMGFNEKMKGVKANFSSADQKSLTVIENQLDQKIHIIYRRLSHTRSGGSMDGDARGVGVEKGRNLTIRQGVEGKSKNLYLPWS